MAEKYNEKFLLIEGGIRIEMPYNEADAKDVYLLFGSGSRGCVEINGQLIKLKYVVGIFNSDKNLFVAY